jgi:hypothetical protein
MVAHELYDIRREVQELLRLIGRSGVGHLNSLNELLYHTFLKS